MDGVGAPGARARSRQRCAPRGKKPPGKRDFERALQDRRRASRVHGNSLRNLAAVVDTNRGVRAGTGSIDAPALLQHGFLALVLADLDHALLALAASLIGVDGFLEAFLARLRARRGAKHGGEVTSRGRRTRREERRAVPIVAPRVGFCGAAPEGCKEGSTRGPERRAGERQNWRPEMRMGKQSGIRGGYRHWSASPRIRDSTHHTSSTRSPRQRRARRDDAMLDDVEAAREETVQSLLREVGHLGPTLRDARVVRRFAETREWNASETSVLLREYHVFRETHGLEDGSLRRDPEVCREMRRRCTMRLLDPRRAPPPAAATSEAASFASTADPASSSSSQALTFPQLNDSSLWPTARDKDDCPVVYVTMDQFASAHQRRRGRESPSSSVVERTLVAILEQVCEEADAAEAGERRPSGHAAAASPSSSTSRDARGRTSPRSSPSARSSATPSSEDFGAGSTSFTSSRRAAGGGSCSKSLGRSSGNTPRGRLS